MKTCDKLMRGIVISMDENRRVFMDGYVAINNGKIESVGAYSECIYQSDTNLGGENEYKL